MGLCLVAVAPRPMLSSGPTSEVQSNFKANVRVWASPQTANPGFVSRITYEYPGFVVSYEACALNEVGRARYGWTG